MTKPLRVVVVDTNLVYLSPQVFNIPELQSEVTTTYVIPATVLWELDVLKSRPETRDKARASINVLKQFAERGAHSRSVSCGARRKIRIASATESIGHHELDAALADDRILSTALTIEANEVILATSDLPMFMKALSLGLSALLLEDYADLEQPSTRRERADFGTKWRRVEASNNLWALCRRGLAFLNATLVRRLMTPVRETRDPPWIATLLDQWDALRTTWTETTNLGDIFKSVFGLDHMVLPNYSVTQLAVPGKPWSMGVTYQERQTTYRPESEAERALRIQREQDIHHQREEFLMDNLLSRLEAIREFVIDQVREALLD